MYPQQYYAPPAPPPLTQAQRDAAIVAEIRRLRAELTTAFNPYSLQKILDGTLQAMEYMLAGAVIQANPNQVPGRPVDPLDSGKTRVEFFGGPQQAPAAPAPQGYGPASPSFPVAQPVAYPAAAGPGYAQPPFGMPAPAGPPPSAPVSNGDVQFVRTEPAPQGVEYFGGPAQQPQAVASYDRNGQRVEFFPNPPGTPTTGAPAGPPVSTQNNPPSAQFMPGAPAMTVEAGHQLPTPYAPQQAPSLPTAPPFASVMPGSLPSPTPPRQPQSREELIGMLPIPTAPNGA